VQFCAANGLSSSQYQYCFADQYCKTDSATQATCETKVCTTGTKGCTGERYGTCDALGSGYTVSPTDCSATGKICGSSGCATSVVDTAGGTGTFCNFYTSDIQGIVVSVATNRTLTELKYYAETDATGAQVHWFIYSATSANGQYTIQKDYFSGTGAGTGWQSSGALSVSLLAGHYYFIGANAVGTTGPYVACGSTNLAPAAMSFGTTSAYDSYYQASAPPFPSSFSGAALAADVQFNLQLTTAP
jgi:hypothetical protein